jgi:hypothetical protein
MNVRWLRSNELLLAVPVIVMVLVGVLAVLVVRQQQDLATDDGQVSVETAPAAVAPSRATTPDPANVLIKPDAPSPAGTGHTAPVMEAPAQATAPDPADTPASSNRPAHRDNRATDPVDQATAPAPADTPTNRERSAGRGGTPWMIGPG